MIGKKKIREIAEAVDATSFLEPGEFLRAVFVACKERVSDYTYNDFSDDLGLGSNNAHLVINGKRELTAKAGGKVADALELVREQRQYFLALVEYHRAKKPGDRDVQYQKLMKAKAKSLPNQLSRDQLSFFNHWYNAAIVELLRLPGSSDEPEWIVKALRPKVTLPEVKASLQLLSDLKYLVRDAKKMRLVPSEAVYSTGNEIRGMAIYRFHQQMIDLATIAMDEVDPDEREISAITLAASPELRELIKQQIVQFRKQILQMAQSEQNPTEIVQVNFQMFPIAGNKGRKS